MEKFKSYLGLVLAAALSSLLINSTELKFPRATPITAMDSTVIVKMTVARTDAFKMWRQATDFMNRCGKPPLVACQELSRHIYSDTILGNMMDILEKHPDFLELYISDSKLDWRADTLERRKFTEAANRVYAEYLDEVRPRIQTNIWLVNLGIVALIMLCVMYRRLAGGIAWAPFGLVWRIVTGGAKAAKKIHEKI